MQILVWVGFLVLIGIFLALDLGVFHKKDEVISTKSALSWTGVWMAAAFLFCIAVYYLYEHHLFGFGAAAFGGHDVGGKEAAINFLTGYVVEKSLSLDNIFVIALIFGFFKVPALYQHRVLFWGIIGALVLRITMILAGAQLIKQFHATIYVFGAILVITALRMAFSSGDDDFNPEDSRIVKIARKLIPISPNLVGHDFFTRIDGKLHATPLFLVLLVVEGTDVVFAVDSIPAIFGITTDPFIVFTSNIFAIMGLRSLYFALASLLREFAYIKHSLVAVLLFVGVKMLIPAFVDYHFPPLLSLGIIVGLLGAGFGASILLRREVAKED